MDAGSKNNKYAFRKHLLHFIDIEQKHLLQRRNEIIYNERRLYHDKILRTFLLVLELELEYSQGSR